jgi:hypothetical protein
MSELVDYKKQQEKRESEYKLAMRAGGLFLLLVMLAIVFIFSHPVQAADLNFSLPGLRNIGDPYIFTMSNVSGTYASVTHHMEVYAVRMMEKNQTPYQYYSPVWGTYFNQTPDPGKKWIFVYVEDWTEGTSYWGYEQDYFKLSVWGNQTIKPEPVQMEDYSTKIKGSIKPADILQTRGTFRGHSYFNQPYGWTDGIKSPRLETLESNAWSGYIKYQVPEKAELDDITVMMSAINKTVSWSLSPREIVQVQPALTVQPVRTMNQTAYTQPDRVGDSPGSPVVTLRERA